MAQEIPEDPVSAGSSEDGDRKNYVAAAPAAIADSSATTRARGSAARASMDPLDPRGVSMDIFELYCHEMLMTESVARRAFLVEKLAYMVRRLIGSQYDYGRLYNWTCAANIVARVCGRHAYATSPNDGIEGEGPQPLRECLSDFTSETWDRVIDQLASHRGSMIRNDATLVVLPSELPHGGLAEERGAEDEECPDERVNEALESRREFSEEYSEMLNALRFHACLSHLGPWLASSAFREEGAEPVVIPHSNIDAFGTAISERFENHEGNEFACVLKGLLEAPVEGNLIRLKSYEEIKLIYSKNLPFFDLEDLQRRFLRLIRRWAKLVLAVPELARLNYGSVNVGDGTVPSSDKENSHALPDSGETSSRADGRGRRRRRPKDQDVEESRLAASAAAGSATLHEDPSRNVLKSSPDEDKRGGTCVKDSKRKREALMVNGQVPLGKCARIAQSARTHSHVLEDSEDGEAAGSNCEMTAKIRLTQQKKGSSLVFTDSDSEGDGAYRVPTRVIPVASKVAPGRKRRFWTAAEDEALVNGVALYGVGRWAEIKAHHHVALRGRSSVQIKDRWRNMKI